MKKKLLALMLAMTMVLGMSTTVMAEETETTDTTVEDPYNGKLDVDPVISKTYVVENGTAPAETFTYKFEGISYVNGDGETVEGAVIPAINDATISFDAISKTTSKDVAIDIVADNYQLGVYTYKVIEVTPDTKTTGVTYSSETLYLVLTIVRDANSGKHYVGAMHYEDATGEDKTTGFTNYYDAGSLDITKEITGNLADLNKKFAFTVVLTIPEGTNATSTVNVLVNGQQKMTFGELGSDTKTLNISLGHGDTLSFENLPEGVTYEVYENNENYTQSATGEAVTEDVANKGDVVTGTISGSTYSDDETKAKTVEEDAVKYVNDLTKEVDTGINLDNLPYIIMLAVVVLGAAAIIIRKRHYTAM